MGKKDKKKGKGAEKTAEKTSKKLEKKAKSALREAGDDEDIDKLIEEIAKAEIANKQSIETVVDKPPSPRLNASWTPHPSKDEIILFGGELYNGEKCFMYNDIFVYHIARQQWRLVKVPDGPTPRSSHQAVSVDRGEGQIWIFGGEFASPSQTQFKHFNELWVLHLGSQYRWEKIYPKDETSSLSSDSSTGKSKKISNKSDNNIGPSARSGHRMVVYKRSLIVFGGFYDASAGARYFNDLYKFDLDNYTWTRIDAGTQSMKKSSSDSSAATGASATTLSPSPRSGFSMFLNGDTLYVYGGYFKQHVKSEIDKGVVHTDMYALDMQTWRWSKVKKQGETPGPRSGMSLALTRRLAVFFGGVVDEETEDELEGTFYNDLYAFHLERKNWFQVSLKGASASCENEDADEGERSDAAELKIIPLGFSIPSPRIQAHVAVKGNIMYTYGGSVEERKKALTLGDFYSLDLSKLDGWKCLYKPADEIAASTWIGKDDDSSFDDTESDENSEDGESDDELEKASHSSKSEKKNAVVANATGKKIKKKLETKEEKEGEDGEHGEDKPVKFKIKLAPSRVMKEQMQSTKRSSEESSEESSNSGSDSNSSIDEGSSENSDSDSQ